MSAKAQSKSHNAVAVHAVVSALIVAMSMILPFGPLAAAAVLSLTYWKDHRTAQIILMVAGVLFSLLVPGIFQWPATAVHDWVSAPVATPEP